MEGCVDGLLIRRGCECLPILRSIMLPNLMLNEYDRHGRFCAIIAFVSFMLIFHALLLSHAVLVALFWVPIVNDAI
jgi:hypothetical protein